MQSWSLDSHPILDKFRKVMGTVFKGGDIFYHLFLPPPYALHNVAAIDPLNYLFVGSPKDGDQIHCFSNPKLIFTFGKNTEYIELKIKKQVLQIKILLTTPCTSSDGLSFNMYEVVTDIYKPEKPPPLYFKVLDSYLNATEAQHFLGQTFKSKKLLEHLKNIDKAIFVTEIDESNRERFVQQLHNSFEDVAEAVFECPETRVLPVAIKNKINFIIFNAITAKCHFKLMMAYNQKYHEENLAAQHAMRQRPKVDNIDSEKMQVAVMKLHNILHMPTPADIIACVTQFFDAVVAALPGVEIAADDILPAICAAMTQDVGFGSHVVSFFNYLSDIWPAVGLDERTSYILITCSIAASHLSMQSKPDEQQEDQAQFQPPPEGPPVDTKQTEETIDLLENLLNNL